MLDALYDRDVDESVFVGRGTLCRQCRENAPLPDSEFCRACLMEAASEPLTRILGMGVDWK